MGANSVLPLPYYQQHMPLLEAQAKLQNKSEGERSALPHAHVPLLRQAGLASQAQLLTLVYLLLPNSAEMILEVAWGSQYPGPHSSFSVHHASLNHCTPLRI